MSSVPRKPLLLQAAAPPALVAAVKRAADREFMSLSEYIRRSLVDRLRADGIDPAAESQH
jgi:hypothetical protein